MTELKIREGSKNIYIYIIQFTYTYNHRNGKRRNRNTWATTYMSTNVIKYILWIMYENLGGKNEFVYAYIYPIHIVYIVVTLLNITTANTTTSV